jgi:hypothetical protein
MNRHQSPHQPGNSDLTALRRRQARKGKRMNKPLWAAVCGTVVAIGIAGAVLADGGTAPQGYADPLAPTACYESVSGILVCESAIPDASPVADATPEPPTKTGIDRITELPSTGAGTTATNVVSGVHTGWHATQYWCGGTYLHLQYRWADWVYSGSYYYHRWSIFPGYSTIVGYC